MVYVNVCLVSCESIDLLTLTRQAEPKVVGEEIIFEVSLQIVVVDLVLGVILDCDVIQQK